MQEMFSKVNEVLDRYPSVLLCIVFGSAISGKSSAASDIDIAISEAQPLEPDLRLDMMEAFASALGREVDLVDLMADRGLILQQAMCTGKIVRNKDKSLYANLISRMLLSQADMMPYYDRILRERRERFLNG
jgi:predicted nucleotidyltransferase